MALSFLPSTFHFAAPFWLWGIALLPLVWLLYGLFYRRHKPGADRLKAFADPHLLPHLMAMDEQSGKADNRLMLSLLAWSLLWVCGLLAMAGPRWDYTDVKTFTSARNLVILLDLSRSMDTADVKPSRLVRARQEIEDILSASGGVNTALIAFASVPHLITPLTDDKETLRRLLPSLETDLVYTQGSYLVPALEMAQRMLENEAGKEKNILILSDGGFDDGDARILQAEQRLREHNIRIHVMGMGTEQGAPVPGPDGYIRKGGKVVISQLEQDRLKRIAQDGAGLYLAANYFGEDTENLLARIGGNAASGEETENVTRFWEERFYLFLIPFLLLALPWFRRNAAFPAMLAAFFLLQPGAAHALDWRSLFLNKEQQGEVAVEQGAYGEAAEAFSDPYRRGVALYKEGNYEAAIESFQAANRPEVQSQARYNLGNAQLMGGQVEEAIQTYEDLLKANPDHEDARHNLEIAKQLLQQQQQGGQDQNQQQNDQGDQQSEQQQNSENGAQQPQEGNEDGQQKPSKQKKSEQGQQDQQGEEQKQDSESEKDKGGNRKQENDSPEQQQEGERSGDQQKPQRSQKDIDADQWLNRIQNDTESFLKNKFYIETQRAGVREGANPW